MASTHRSGWRSSKLHLALIAIAVLTLVFVFVIARTGEPAGFGEFRPGVRRRRRHCVALVSLVASYSGSRVAESFAQRPARTPTPSLEKES